MFATKSVENIQFLPFLTTDIKYSGVEPWGGGVAVEGSRTPPAVPTSACAVRPAAT